MRSALLAGLALFAASTQAGAATIATLTGISGNTTGGTAVAPYYLSIDGAPALDVICLDVNRHMSIGESWNITVNGISDANLDFAPSFDKYKAAAVLWTQMQQGALSYGEGQYAVWNLFTPSFSLAPAGPGALTAQTAAIQFVANNPTANYSGITIFTPVSHGTGNDKYQELMTGQVATPEPGTLALMGVSLIALGVYMRRRSKS